MDSLWKIWAHRWINVDPGTYFTCKIWTSGVCRGVYEVSGNYSGPSVQQHTMYCSHNPGCTQPSFLHTLYNFWRLNTYFKCYVRLLRCTDVIHFSRHATVDSTNVLSSYLKEVRRQNVHIQWCIQYFVSIIRLCFLSFCWYNHQQKETVSFSDMCWFNLSVFTTVDMPSCGWYTVETNFPNILFRGEPILGGSN